MKKTDPSTEPARALASLLATSASHGYGIYLGMGKYGPCFAAPEQGVLVLGPPRAGKTSSIVVPNVLTSSGSVLAVSTKRDLIDSTATARRRLGKCLLFDPSGSISPPHGVERVGWSPLVSSVAWNAAVLTTEAMVGASREGATHGSGAHWTERAGALIASLFHAAALDDASMADVMRAVNRREPDRFVEALARHNADLALDLLSGILATDAREQSGIWSTASGVLAAYRTPESLATDRHTRFDATAFVKERQTLFITVPTDHQLHLAPLVAGVVRDIRTAAYGIHRQQQGLAGRRSTQPPVLLVLDELANIAPLHDLPSLVAEGASQGVLTLACLQDLSQARQRWGTAADGFPSLFGVKVVLGGLGDSQTLRNLSLLAGDHDVRTRSTTRSKAPRIFGGRTSMTTSTRRERRLPPDAIAQLAKGAALVIDGAQPSLISLTPFFSTPVWRDATLAYKSPHARDRLDTVSSASRDHMTRNDDFVR